MKRYIEQGAEAFNEAITDEQLEKACAVINNDMGNRTEDKERECHVYKDERFSIACRTTFDYRCYKFAIENGEVVYKGMEGDFRN